MNIGWVKGIVTPVELSSLLSVQLPEDGMFLVKLSDLDIRSAFFDYRTGQWENVNGVKEWTLIPQ